MRFSVDSDEASRPEIKQGAEPDMTAAPQRADETGGASGGASRAGVEVRNCICAQIVAQGDEPDPNVGKWPEAEAASQCSCAGGHRG